MRWVVYAALSLIIAVIAAVVIAPVGFVMKQVSASDARIQYASAEGSVWNGKVRDIRYGIQSVGDADVKTSWLALFTGHFSSDIRLTGSGLNGRGQVAAGFGGDVTIRSMRVLGSTADLINITSEVRDLAGEFTIDVQRAELKDNRCTAAQGTVWTDILTRMERRYRWTGPELSGPISCENGQFVIALSGQNADGENVSARLEIGLDATGNFLADVTTTSRETIQALTLLGFEFLGDDVFRYQYVITQ